MRGMAIRLPTCRAVAVSAALLAAGAAFLPLAIWIDPNRSLGLFGLCIVAMAALPLAGVSVMLGRSWLDTCTVFVVAVVVSIALFLSAHY